MRTRFALLDPVVMNRSNPVPPGAFAHACSFVRHAVPNALAAAALLSPGIGGAAPTCADVLKSIEKRLALKAQYPDAEHPVLCDTDGPPSVTDELIPVAAGSSKASEPATRVVS